MGNTPTGLSAAWETTGNIRRNRATLGAKTALEILRKSRFNHFAPGTRGVLGRRACRPHGSGAQLVPSRGDDALDFEPRLVTGPEALRYLGGERPERFGVEPIQGKRQRLYDRRAIDAALDRLAGLEMARERVEVDGDPMEALVDEWR